MQKRLQNTRKKFFLLLALPLGLGLSGLILLRKKRPISNSSSFDVLDNTPYNLMKPFIIAQSKVESANYTSDLFRRSNNAFGMKNAVNRPQLGSPEIGTDYRKYNSLQQSIKDLILWFDYTEFPTVTTTNGYVRNLKDRNYFESNQSDYVNALNSWL